MSDKSHITCEHLMTLRRGDLPHVILDIRDPLEFDAGHISKSINIPRKEIGDNIDVMIPDKTKRVVVIAGTTAEADFEKIQGELHELGYPNVEFLAGGFDQWCEIAPLEIEPDLTELTPEESGETGDELTEIDPEVKDNEPLY